MNVFLDGRLELSNNRVERSVRPFALGRKTGCFPTRLCGILKSQKKKKVKQLVL